MGPGSINKLISVCRSSGTSDTCKTLQHASGKTFAVGLSRSLDRSTKVWFELPMPSPFLHQMPTCHGSYLSSAFQMVISTCHLHGKEKILSRKPFKRE
ncbi:unnamed protein product, partial [Gulo gulo]